MASSDRVPFITDSAHLAAVAGTAYACLRPSGDVATIYHEVQELIRAAAPSLSFPNVHCSLKGFGTPEWRVDEERLDACAAVVDAVARRSPQLELEVDGLDMFTELSLPIVRIRATEELGRALRALRVGADRPGCPPGDDDRIPSDDWVFHLSLAYAEDDHESDAVRRVLDATTLPPARCSVGELELVYFDGGVEQLVDVFPLAASSDSH
jgi:hypothetical protein